MTTLFQILSDDEKQQLTLDFANLKKACFPTLSKPSFNFKNRSQFTKTDLLSQGHDTARLKPDELNQLWQDRQTLRDLSIDYIVAGGQKWFYNTWLMTGDFFSQDGQKKVEVQFDFWVDPEQVWPIQGVRPAIKQVLELCSDSQFPTQKQAQDCFSDDLCRKIYEKQPSNETIGTTVMSLIEHLRQFLLKKLVQNHTPQIMTKPAAQKIKKNDPKKADTTVVSEYLKQNKNMVYILSEQYGYIKKARALLHYQRLRDSVRHKDEVVAQSFNPIKVFQNICKTLGIKHGGNPAKTPLKFFDNQTQLNWHIADMSEITDACQMHIRKHQMTTNQKLKPKDPNYWQALQDAGVLDQTEATTLPQKIKEYNTVAHGNAGARELKEKLADDIQVEEIQQNVLNRHWELLKRWLDDHDRAF